MLIKRQQTGERPRILTDAGTGLQSLEQSGNPDKWKNVVK